MSFICNYSFMCYLTSLKDVVSAREKARDDTNCLS